MTTVQTYLEFLRAGLWDRPAVVSGPVQLKEVIQLASNQSTLQTVYHAILSIPTARIPQKTEEMMRALLGQTAKSHDAADKVIAYVSGELAHAGIPSVLLKGQGIACYYPVKGLRQAGDIDLYVKPSDYEKACGMLTAMFGQGEEDTDKHRAFHVGGTLELELHRYTETLDNPKQNPIYQAISDRGTSEGIVPVTLAGNEVMTPEDTFNAFYIFHHLWEHTRNMGIGMRQLCDWSVFLRTHKDKLDCDALKKWLTDLHLLDVWQVFGCTAVSALGLEPSEVPFYSARKTKRGERLVGYILQRGDNLQFKHGRSRNQKLKHKFGSFIYIFTKFRRMVGIFPSIAIAQLFSDLGSGIGKLLKK